MSSYTIKSRNSSIELNGISFSDKLAAINKMVTDEKEFIMAEDVNQIKKVVNDLCKAFETYSKTTVNDLIAIQMSIVPKRSSTDVDALSARFTEFNQLMAVKISQLSSMILDNSDDIRALENTVTDIFASDISELEDKINLINELLSDDMTILLDKVNELQELSITIPYPSENNGSSMTIDNEYLNSLLSTKQDKITSTNKLSYSLIEDTPAIPSKTSDLQNDSGFVDSSTLASKQDRITYTNKLAYSLLSGTPVIPSKTSDLTNDIGYITASDLANFIFNGKLTIVSGETILGTFTANQNGDIVIDISQITENTQSNPSFNQGFPVELS